MNTEATDPADLERKILDPNISKNEAEWWARERILALEKLIEESESAKTMLAQMRRIAFLKKEVDKAERERKLCYACGKALEEANERKEHEAIYHGSIEMHSMDSTGNGPRIACVRTRESRQQSYLNRAPVGSLPSPLYPRTIQGPTFFSDNPDHYHQPAATDSNTNSREEHF